MFQNSIEQTLIRSFREHYNPRATKYVFLEPASPGVTPCSKLLIQGQSKVNQRAKTYLSANKIHQKL